MKQFSLAETGFLPKAGKQTRKAVFLSEMETVVPWSRLESLIEPFYPKKGNDHPPMPLATMLRIHFLQQWLGYADPAMEKALHDIPLLRQFAGLDAFEDVMPDESTILRFRHMLEQNELVITLFAEVNAVLSEKGLSMNRGSVVDDTLIAAPSSTKNQDKKRDPEMSQTKKGNQWYFGMTSRRRRTPAGRSCEAGCGDEQSEAAQEAYIGVYAESGLSILVPSKKPKGGDLTKQQKKANRILSAIRAVVEHPFRVIKQQFGFTKARYRGLKKITGQIVTLFALSNLWMARHRLMSTKSQLKVMACSNNS